MELLHDARKTNKRMFIIIIVILAMFTALLGYTLYLLNDIGTIEETTSTQEISDIDTINNSSINNGGK
jgi:flagellar basal body-associated protein FliL